MMRTKLPEVKWRQLQPKDVLTVNGVPIPLPVKDETSILHDIPFKVIEDNGERLPN